MIRFTYEYEELPLEGDLIDLEAEVVVDPYDQSEWHFEAVKLSKYNEDQDDWYVVQVFNITDPLLRAVSQLFTNDYKLRFSLEEAIDDEVQGRRDSVLEQLGKDRAKGLEH